MTLPNLFLGSYETKIFANITSFISSTSSSLYPFGRYWDRPTYNIEESVYEYIRRL
jgi:hypothetical protein